MNITAKEIAPGQALDDAYAVRMEVFVREQGFSTEIEVDEIDVIAHHIVLYDDNGKPIATGRTFPSPQQDGVYILGRIAALQAYRGHGIGRRVMDELERMALAQGAKTLQLGAQCRAKGFYERLGYTPFGETYYEEYCEHIHMQKTV